MKHIKKFEQIKWEFDEEENPEIKIGSIVKFKKVKNGNICDFYVDYYLNPYIIHGSRYLKENKGIVVNIINHNNINYYIVKYIDINNNRVQLGFNIEDLE